MNCRRFVLVIIACVILVGLAAVHRAVAFDPCCNISGIDRKTGMVTAKEKSTGRVFTFRVTDATLLGSLRVDQGIYANFTSKQVSVDGIAPCCAIASLEPPDGAKNSGTQASFVPCCNVAATNANTGQVTVREKANGRLITIKVALAPAQLAQTFMIGTPVGFDPVDGAKLTAGTKLRLQAAGFQPVDGIVSQITTH